MPVRFVPLSTAEAVLRYATDFLPSWAGAISLDLMPAVLIFIHVIVHAAIRREEGADRDEDTMTAGEVMRAVRIYHAIRDQDEAPRTSPPPSGYRETQVAEAPPTQAPERHGATISPINPALGHGRQQ